MSITMRVSRPTFNALTDINIYNYSIYADSDNVLIKEHSRGSGDLAAPVTITHSLGYIPFFLLYSEVSAGRYRVNSFYDVSGGGWRVNANTTTIEIDNPTFDANTDGYRYYIFYDQLT